MCTHTFTLDDRLVDKKLTDLKGIMAGATHSVEDYLYD